jgi:hypothetical protein
MFLNLKDNLRNTGQVLVIVVFVLTFSLLSIYMLLAPIKDKLLRKREMENVYQAVANSEKGLEAALLERFKEYNLSVATSTLEPDPSCGGLKDPSVDGTCTRILYESTGTQWDTNSRKIFKTDAYIFSKLTGDFWTKAISDGIKEKVIRTIQIGPLK